MPIKEESIHDTNERITCKTKLIDTFRFMRSSLSGLVDNLSEIKDNKCLDEKTMKDLIKNSLTLKDFAKVILINL